jgi:hypothetical protein
VEEHEDGWYLKSDLYEAMYAKADRVISTDVLGMAFEPEENTRILTGHRSYWIKIILEILEALKCTQARSHRARFPEQSFAGTE